MKKVNNSYKLGKKYVSNKEDWSKENNMYSEKTKANYS